MTPQPDFFPTVQTIKIRLTPEALKDWIAQNPDKRILTLNGLAQAIRDHHWTAQIADRKPDPT